MKILLPLLGSFIFLISSAQKNTPYPSSDSIRVMGVVNKSAIISMADLALMPDTTIASLKILNHRGDYKTTYSNVKLVLLKRLVENNLQAAEKPKELESMYFTCKAMDDYKVVYSYREVFKATDHGIYIIVAYDNFTLTNMPEKPMLLHLGNSASGNIGLRGLKTIDVRKAE